MSAISYLSTRRTLLRGLFASLLLPTRSSARTRCPTFGAIRWDAQYCDTRGEPCYEEEKALSPQHWQFRAPLHSRLTDSKTLQFNATEASFDQEIRVAHAAGLGYWAYLAYGRDGKLDLAHSMMQGLKYHRRSGIADQMSYCLIATLDTLGRANGFDEATKRIHDLFSDHNYQRTKDGRPLLFLYYLDALLPSYWNGSLAELGKSMSHLRNQTTSSGDKNPYIVLLHTPATTAETVRKQIGADAISAYGINFGPNRSGTYPELQRHVEHYWEDELAQTAGSVVPTVMVGWDSRPRKETPPAYDKRDYTRIDKSAHVAIATPSEFSFACRQASRFMSSHPDRCPYQIALVYSWNEYSEGGALAPTLGDPSASMLRTASEVLEACRAGEN